MFSKYIWVGENVAQGFSDCLTYVKSWVQLGPSTIKKGKTETKKDVCANRYKYVYIES